MTGLAHWPAASGMRSPWASHNVPALEELLRAAEGLPHPPPPHPPKHDATGTTCQSSTPPRPSAAQLGPRSPRTSCKCGTGAERSQGTGAGSIVGWQGAHVGGAAHRSRSHPLQAWPAAHCPAGCSRQCLSPGTRWQTVAAATADPRPRLTPLGAFSRAPGLGFVTLIYSSPVCSYNIWHTWNEGLMGAFQTLREQGLLPLAQVDEQGNMR